MKINKTLKKALGIFFGTFIVLFIVLVVHIATAKPVDNATLQISRIDFTEPIDSLKAKEIHRNLKSIPGVKNDHFDLQKGVLVYFHDNRIADSKSIFDQLMQKGHYKARRFVLPPGIQNKQVCPVMNQNGFAYRFSKTIQHIFN